MNIFSSSRNDCYNIKNDKQKYSNIQNYNNYYISKMPEAKHPKETKIKYKNNKFSKKEENEPQINLIIKKKKKKKENKIIKMLI